MADNQTIAEVLNLDIPDFLRRKEEHEETQAIDGARGESSLPLRLPEVPEETRTNDASDPAATEDEPDTAPTLEDLLDTIRKLRLKVAPYMEAIDQLKQQAEKMLQKL